MAAKQMKFDSDARAEIGARRAVRAAHSVLDLLSELPDTLLEARISRAATWSWRISAARTCAAPTWHGRTSARISVGPDALDSTARRTIVPLAGPPVVGGVAAGRDHRAVGDAGDQGPEFPVHRGHRRIRVVLDRVQQQPARQLITCYEAF